jgi:hypothetical protein
MNTTLVNPAMSDMYALCKKYEQAERTAKLFRRICPPNLFNVVINRDGKVRAKSLTLKK